MQKRCLAQRSSQAAKAAVLLLLIQRLRSSLSVRQQVGTCPHEAQLDLPA